MIAASQRILLAGGGTAGHVNPLLAVVDELRRLEPALKLQWLGSERVESRLVPAYGVEFSQIDIRFSWRRPTPANWGYYFRHILPLISGRPFRQALRALEAFAPQLVLASGGYVAAPALWAAQRLNIPCALLQIDSPPGLVNWWFAPQAWRVFAATEQIIEEYSGRCAREKLVLTGCPALKPRQSRAQFCAAQGLDPARRLLVVMGGSLGAGALQRITRETLSAAAKSLDPRYGQLTLLYIGGERGAAAAADELPDGPITYHPAGYIEHAADALAAADFYLGRSGAATVGELLAAGIPALLAPDPQHADRQQFRNAHALVERGQATVIEQRQLTGELVLEWLKRVWDQPRLPAAQPSPAELIATEILTLWEPQCD